MLLNNMVLPLLHDSVWLDKYKYDDAEKLFHERQAKKEQSPGQKCTTSLADEIACARKRIQNSLKSASVKLDLNESPGVVNEKIQKLETDYMSLKTLVINLEAQLSKALSRIEILEAKTAPSSKNPTTVPLTKNPVPAEVTASADDDDDDIDLFGSEDDEDATKLREERLKAYETKKAKKAPVVAKSSVVLDVKPWDDETDLKEMEVKVREIKADGLVWGASKLVPLAYGIQKLQIVAVVEDEKISVDWLQETIQEIEDLVQSVDIAAFNKL